MNNNIANNNLNEKDELQELIKNLDENKDISKRSFIIGLSILVLIIIVTVAILFYKWKSEYDTIHFSEDFVEAFDEYESLYGNSIDDYNYDYDYDNNNPNVSSSTNTYHTYSEGMYKVGTDIPAGEYNLLVLDPEYNGYYYIYSDITKEDTVDSDYFSENAYIIIEDGQYLKLRNCYVEE